MEGKLLAGTLGSHKMMRPNSAGANVKRRSGVAHRGDQPPRVTQPPLSPGEAVAPAGRPRLGQPGARELAIHGHTGFAGTFRMGQASSAGPAELRPGQRTAGVGFGLESSRSRAAVTCCRQLRPVPRLRGTGRAFPWPRFAGSLGAAPVIPATPSHRRRAMWETVAPIA